MEAEEVRTHRHRWEPDQMETKDMEEVFAVLRREVEISSGWDMSVSRCIDCKRQMAEVVDHSTREVRRALRPHPHGFWHRAVGWRDHELEGNRLFGGHIHGWRGLLNFSEADHNKVVAKLNEEIDEGHPPPHPTHAWGCECGATVVAVGDECEGRVAIQPAPGTQWALVDHRTVAVVDGTEQPGRLPRPTPRPEPEESTTDLTISATTWRCYERSGPAHDGHWEFKGTVKADDADPAARQHCVNAWASGEHAILVVNADEAREFLVTVEVKEVSTESQ